MPERGVRVRGIYATAVARLLIEHGLKVVDASWQLRERFGEAVSEGGVAVATVKDRDDRRGLVVVGRRRAVEDVLSALRGALRRSPIIVLGDEIYATYACRALDDRTVELPGGREGLLEGGGARAGDVVIAHVYTFRRGVPVLRRGAALVGDYARLVEGQPHDVSEHVRGPLRNLLLTLAVRAGLEGWGVKWRSSARWAEMAELLAELQRLKEEAAKLKEAASKAVAPSKLSEGELLAIVPLSLDDKARLDSLRSSCVPTLPLHHFFKACGDQYSSLVDIAESTFLGFCGARELARALMARVEGSYPPSGVARLLHEKLDGEVVAIEGEYRVVARAPLTLRLERRVRGGGVYDGLRIPKEEGDTIVSVVTLGSYVVPHAYLAPGGRLKGVYVNVNSPIEAQPPSSFWYLDLCVDVVWTKDRGVEVVDLEELRSYSSCLGEEVARSYEALANEVARRLSGVEAELEERAIEVLLSISRSFVTEHISSIVAEDQRCKAFNAALPVSDGGGARARSKGAD